MQTEALRLHSDLSLAMASLVFEDAEDIQYRDLDWEAYGKASRKTKNLPKDDFFVDKVRRPNHSDVSVFVIFTQTWGSTALGFGGIGGQAVTEAHTIILECRGRFFVYFGGRFAYSPQKPNQEFFDDINKRYMKSVKDSHAYNTH